MTKLRTFESFSLPAGRVRNGCWATTLSRGRTAFAAVLLCAATATVSAAQAFKSLASFDRTNGASPSAGLVQGTDGNFYGTTEIGGANCRQPYQCGTVFEIAPAGKLTTLHSFDGTDGSYPFAALIQATNGNFYGTTSNGGASDNCEGGCGTVFGLSVGLGPFVETRPTSGKVGAKVIILGNNLTGTTSVTFNGTAATFTLPRALKSRRRCRAAPPPAASR